MDVALAIISAAAAVAASVAAFGSWRAADRANDTAVRLADIERSRRHEELTPDFDIFMTRGGTDEQADLRLRLTRGQPVLDQVIVRVLDERDVDHWGNGYPDGVSPEKAALFVWGPWELNKLAAAQVADNRTSRPRSLSRLDGHDWLFLPLVRTRPGHWMTAFSQESWREQFPDVIRIQIVCSHAGDAPWVLTRDVEAP